MGFDDVWSAVREAIDDLPDDAVLVTPTTDRPFTVEEAGQRRLTVQFLEGDERTLWGDQFAVLYERIGELPDGLPLEDLPFAAEPYLTVLSLHPDYGVDDAAGTFGRVSEPTAAGRYVAASEAVEEAEPATLATDALLLSDALERHDAGDPDALSTETLVNLYVLLSAVQRQANRVRRTLADELLDRVDTDRPVVAQYGAVQRTTRTRRHVKDDETVFDALDDLGVPREWVTGVVPEKLDVVLAVTDLAEEDVYALETETYVRRAEVSESAKAGRLAGLRERLAGVGDEEADRLQEEIERLEERIDDLLAEG